MHDRERERERESEREKDYVQRVQRKYSKRAHAHRLHRKDYRTDTADASHIIHCRSSKR